MGESKDKNEDKRYIKVVSRRPVRSQVISEEEIVNLKIDLELNESVDKFIESIK
ncbi:MAG: hypothetical protein ACLFQK_06540 [Fibrobacterota bacterium]